MSIRHQSQKLKNLSPDQIQPNPENPRLVFRPEEMESLMVSIDKHGIQVPVTVYQEGEVYRLLDGERRWRCSRKLNLKSIPAIVQDKPTELENLVLMYNIHALREQWDYYTIASKLERVIDLYELQNGERPGEIILSELTGLTRGAIRRCYLLLDLPDRFKDRLLEELDKPKLQQRLTEDFFIEMEKSLKTVVRRLPEYGENLDTIRDTLIEKYQDRKISAVTDFRQLSKIATAIDGLGIAQREARRALNKVFARDNDVGIKDAYEEAVAFEYGERKALRNVTALTDFIDGLIRSDDAELDPEVIESFEILLDKLLEVLGRAK